MPPRAPFLAVLAATLAACAQLIGSDFSGDSRPDGAGDAGGVDGAAPGTDGAAPTDAASPPSDAAGPLADSTPGVDGADAGPTVYCGDEPDASECVCATTPSKGLTANAPCTATREKAPSLCCTATGWPNVASWCVCSSIYCQTDVFGDVCQCGFAAPDVGEHPTTKCTGTVCCREKSTLAPTCACYTQNIPCPNGSEVVPSCSAADLQCDDLTVSACR